VTIHLYLDEDAVDKDLVRALRARGVDVEAANEAGMIERSDDEQLEYATAKGRVVYSFNRGHFCRLHAQWLAAGRRHAGIVVARQQQYSVGDQMHRLLKLIAAKTADDMHNHLEFLSDWA
jgi:uncharacterized protein with PIN domain